MVHSTAKHCARVSRRSAYTHPTPLSTTPCKLWHPTPAGQPSNPRRHPTCWASSQWSHTVCSTLCHGAWTPAPLSAHPSIKYKHMAPQTQTPICTRRTTSQQLIRQQQHVWRSGRITYGMRSGQTISQASTFSFPTLVPTPPEWPSQEEPGSGSTTFAPVLTISAPACINGLWLPLQPVIMVQKNKLSTMLSSNVQSISLPMDWRFWMMRQPNGCSTTAPRSSVAKQWFEKKIEHGILLSTMWRTDIHYLL